MRTYVLQKEQLVQSSLSEVWEFFSDPSNLEIITPPHLSFSIHPPVPRIMEEGLEIQYTVTPLFKIPLRWVSKITTCEPPYYFVDEQKKGPFKKWVHQHKFIPKDKGVKVVDKVEYQLPLGPLGRLAHYFIVNSRIQGIFQYRQKVVDQIFHQNKTVHAH